MLKILFFTSVDIDDLTYGGGKGSRTRYELIKKIANVDICLVTKESNIASMLSIVQGYYPPMRKSKTKSVLKRISVGEYDCLFIDNSVVGKLVLRIKRKYHSLPIISYFQNCEYDWIDVRFAGKKTLKSLVYKYLVWKSEYLTLKCSDISISFLDRDSKRIKEIYGEETAVIFPLFLKDEVNEDIFNKYSSEYCLLFGPAEKANLEGFIWFANNVSSHIPIKTIIAGKGFEHYKDKIVGERVEVVGFVDNIFELYQRAAFVCIPLFSGGGMKIKTVEAMMFGKYIYGSDEAFAGYNVSNEKIGGLCNNASEYIEKINYHINNDLGPYNLYARETFINNYSETCMIGKYRNLFNSIGINSNN